MKTKIQPGALSGQIEVIKQGKTSVNQLTNLIEEAFKKFAPKRLKKMPLTVSVSDNGACFVSIVGDMCISINFTEIGKEDRI